MIKCVICVNVGNVSAKNPVNGTICLFPGSGHLQVLIQVIRIVLNKWLEKRSLEPTRIHFASSEKSQTRMLVVRGIPPMTAMAYYPVPVQRYTLYDYRKDAALN